MKKLLLILLVLPIITSFVYPDYRRCKCKCADPSECEIPLPPEPSCTGCPGTTCLQIFILAEDDEGSYQIPLDDSGVLVADTTYYLYAQVNGTCEDTGICPNNDKDVTPWTEVVTGGDGAEYVEVVNLPGSWWTCDVRKGLHILPGAIGTLTLQMQFGGDTLPMSESYYSFTLTN